MHSMNNQDYKAFLDKVIGSGVVDEFNAEMFGNEVNREIELPDKENAVAMRFICSALIDAHNNAIDQSDFHHAAMYYRLMQRYMQLDDVLIEEFEESQQIHPLEMMLHGQ